MPDLETMRHSASHVMAEALQHLFPDAKFGIGPAIENGFYYDVELPRSLTPEDLEKIEKEMGKIVAANQPFVRSEMNKQQAREFFEKRNQPFKVEIIDELEDDRPSIYQQGDFTDLCRGPHVENSGEIGAFKLLNVAGAYWRGDEKRPMLQRIYGTVFPTKEELDQYLWQLEEAKKRDHRKLGQDLDLFSISEDVGPGLILWHPKGAAVRVAIEDFWRKAHYEHGYDIVFTPHVGRAHLWETSGHLGFYSENMYAPMELEGEAYYAKPMNCPFHIQIYQTKMRSYRDLPMRLAELGTVYRFERSGVLHGLLRVRGFTQDDAHIFCTPEQIEDEVLRALDFTIYLFTAFGFTNYDVYLSTRPQEKYVGDLEDWDKATEALRQAIIRRGLEYHLDEGGGAFYGPKIDIKIKDALGRSWQCTTIQFDFNMSARFGLTYVGEDGKEHRPFMVHRALLGSMERFFAILVEQYGGAFPLWLAPVQATVIPIADRHLDYAENAAKRLRAAGLRVDVDGRREKVNFKIREAQLQKVPYMLVVGDREIEADSAAVRSRSGGDLGPKPLAQIEEMMLQQVKNKE
ncbi:MAG TPA: threonine--tRNA ligase [Chloroflexota bacterium]|nr:threonine--tRNA ligase [Chloroflexota bacterium]